MRIYKRFQQTFAASGKDVIR